ncbi:hypothetical protein AURDEDRAFT_129722 [Auricularia subglabra TFB-10046 SS5]|uniref:Mid2 domain-containing protein n=1 Tax=Auricularia subglabra (strain TFB-10046 / SS5) TaxID=717982 RepID=J0LGU1_AURST|nr:hypothetical protein AURDEDRAFT_129722 [Auricularia subglabra TFB-10046 SS5]
MSCCQIPGHRGVLLALLFATFASAAWISAVPPYGRWTLTTADPDSPNGIFDIIYYVDCSANISPALSMNVFAIATMGNITGSNLRLLIHTSLDGVDASVRLTDNFCVPTDSTVSSLLSAEKCPDIAVDLALDPTRPGLKTCIGSIDQSSPSQTHSQSPETSTKPQSQDSSRSSEFSLPSSPTANESQSSRVPVALIAGSVAGGLALLAITVLLLVLFRRRRQTLRRGSWSSGINGEAVYDPQSSRPYWSTTGNIPTITSTGPSVYYAPSDFRSSTHVKSHASMSDLPRTSYSGQPSVLSPVRHSGLSAVSSSTRPLSSLSVSAVPEHESMSHNAAGPAGVTILSYSDAPPAYGPPESTSG